MSIKIGIVGLPNVGKSTLFNILTDSNIEAANYPFATIEPNIGVVEVKDERLIHLAEEFSSKKTIFNIVEFIDIAGLVKGASEGAGLGNKFLENIKSTDAILNVVRGFEDKDIVNTQETVDPIRDIEIIRSELILADLYRVEDWLTKNKKKTENSKIKEQLFYLSLMEKSKEILLSEKKLIEKVWTSDEFKVLKQNSFLTLKPTLYLLNISDTDFGKDNVDFIKKVESYVGKDNLISVSVGIENELAGLSKEERSEFLSEYNLKKTGIDLLAEQSFRLLGLETFFTAGKEEAKAWSFEKGSLAPQAAGKIHSDFERGFIKVSVYNYNDFKLNSSETELKELGKIRTEGKDYVVQDGDVCFFKFNV